MSKADMVKIMHKSVTEARASVSAMSRCLPTSVAATPDRGSLSVPTTSLEYARTDHRAWPNVSVASAIYGIILIRLVDSK